MEKHIPDKTYGRSPDNPVLLNSVQLSLEYMNNLVTTEGLHIVYHRLGSSFTENPVDHYELLTTDLKYDDIYISIYAENVLLVPPEGYLFESFFDIFYQFEEDDFYYIEDKYIYLDKHESSDIITSTDKNQLLPPLERILLNSGGSNMRDRNFPFTSIESLVLKEGVFMDKLNDVIKIIPPRPLKKNNRIQNDSRN